MSAIRFVVVLLNYQYPVDAETGYTWSSEGSMEAICAVNCHRSCDVGVIQSVDTHRTEMIQMLSEMREAGSMFKLPFMTRSGVDIVIA
jgi:hypothetical protein